MLIGGIEKLSLIDFPGNISTVVFTSSCNFRCHFCYNPMLVLANGEGESNYKEKDFSLVPERDLFLFLESRVGKIDGVVISGGEPTLQPDLEEFIEQIKKMGFKIKLDTNGTRPEIIKKLISKKLVNYIAMDVKAPLEKYEKVVGVSTNIDKIKESIAILIEGDLPYEFRTTLVPGLHELPDLLEMTTELKGAEKWFLQKFKSDTSLINHNFQGRGFFSEKEVQPILEKIKEKIPGCDLRE
jgi:pyruvate formate lyase activating enzyme